MCTGVTKTVLRLRLHKKKAEYHSNEVFWALDSNGASLQVLGVILAIQFLKCPCRRHEKKTFHASSFPGLPGCMTLNSRGSKVGPRVWCVFLPSGSLAYSFLSLGGGVLLQQYLQWAPSVPQVFLYPHFWHLLLYADILTRLMTHRSTSLW